MSEAAIDLIKFDPEAVKARRRHYETIFILNPSLDEKKVEAIVEKAKKTAEGSHGTLLRTDDWGKKKMAFELDKHAQGRYFFFRYIGRSETVNSFERILKLDADVLRYKTVRLSDILSEAEIKTLIEKAPEDKPRIPGESYEEEDYGSYR